MEEYLALSAGVSILNELLDEGLSDGLADALTEREHQVTTRGIRR